MTPALRAAARILFSMAGLAVFAAFIPAGIEQAMKFEVASIRSADPADTTMYSRPLPGGGYQARNISVLRLIQNAYNLHDFQIVGAPGWVETAKYDIYAKAEGNDSLDREAQVSDRRARLQSLLGERFQLRSHPSSKEIKMYALVAGDKVRLQPVSNPPVGSPMSMARGELRAEAVSMAILAGNLANILGTTVQDQTGLPGKYKFTLTWAPEDESGSPDGALSGSDAPSIFAAVKEQLGLRLEPRTGRVPTLVIDHIERPSAN